MSTLTLEKFAQAIPVCEQTFGLATVLEIFQSTGCEAIVVVSEQQRPLGVVKLRQLLPHLLSSKQLGKTPVGNPIGDIYKKPLSALNPSVIEPLAILPAQLSLTQFWGYLQESRLAEEEHPKEGAREKHREYPLVTPLPNQSWGLVDEEGKFLGLLNSWLLLKYLAPNFTALNGSTGADAEPELTGLKPLVQLLEQLPLPLSIQTATGQVLAQNLTWRHQIGTSPELGWVRSTTAAMLDSPSAEPRSDFINSPVSDNPATLPRSAFTVENVVQGWYKPSAHGARDSYCAIDTPRLAATVSKSRTILSPSSASKTQETSPSWETSIPVSEARTNSQERVFSFVKIPLSPSLVKEIRIGIDRGNRQDITRSALSPFTSDLYVVLAQDTTEQQQVSKELAAKNAELVQLNRLKDEFLACISHELKTPLTAVLGLSTLLKDQALGKLNERQVRYARLIYQSGRQLMTVVNDILDLTRMETGQLELTVERVQIKAVCDRAYSQVRQVQLEKDQEEDSELETQFTLQIEPGLERLIADELRLCQMLVHLLSNALKFTDPGGEIGLRVNRWEGWIAFSVWDTGIGIPSEKQHLIFQKFQQLEHPRTRRFEGTGLGLALTQRLARLHGGDVSFISKAGQGSEFTLLLPSCPPQAKEQELKSEEKSQVGRLKVESSHRSNPPFGNTHGEQPLNQAHRNHLVLIVETVPRYLENLMEQLNSLGSRVVIARSGPEAIEKARRLQPHTVLLNPLLPQLSGWDVLTLLKSDTQTQHIPVLITATQAEKQQAHHNKADGFLSLPVQKQALLESLNGLVEHQFPAPNNLTILHLSPDLDKMRCDLSVLSSELTDLLNLQHSELNYRVLEADDLEQAELLARVWHPDVVLLESAGVTDPVAYLKDFSLHTGLTSLPLVTLDRQTTEAANQVTGLSVYPCLAVDHASKIPALLQVIKVAAGMVRKPTILVMEVSAAQQELELSQVELQKPNKTLPQRIRRRNSSDSLAATFHSSWLQALIQYLQTAGFRSILSSCWAQVYRQIQDQSVDLLLIRIKDVNDSVALVKNLIALKKLQQLPPILVLDHRLEADSGSVMRSDRDRKDSEATPGASTLVSWRGSKRASSKRDKAQAAEQELARRELAVGTSDVSQLDESVSDRGESSDELEALLESIATQILHGPSQSMAQLLEQLNQVLR